LALRKYPPDEDRGLVRRLMILHKSKQSPSAHQMQIRFFIGLFVALIMLVTFLLFWFMDWLTYHTAR
jgi:hypothetical protein